MLFFHPKAIYQGTLYRLDEHCYYKTTTGDLAAIRIINIFAWNIYGVYYLFVKKRKYRSCGVHADSDNPLVCEIVLSC